MADVSEYVNNMFTHFDLESVVCYLYIAQSWYES